MHPLHDYFCTQLERHLKSRAIVAFYDADQEWSAFIAELPRQKSPHPGLERVMIGKRQVYLAVYGGSYFSIRQAVEPVAGVDRPEDLLIYIPGMTRDPHGSVLMELEKGGMVYTPRLKGLARIVMRSSFSDGQIDEMLAPTGVGYPEIVAFLKHGQSGGEGASILRTIFEGLASEPLISLWLADDSLDAAIVNQDAVSELHKLLRSRLTLEVEAKSTLAAARDKAWRYLLVNEFRQDLDCDPPSSIAMVPAISNQDQEDRLRTITRTLRDKYPDAYRDHADRIESDLGLATCELDPAGLGSIDTFRFEEVRLLAHAAKKIEAKDYPAALAIVTGRKRSFWVDHNVARQAQWEACRLMAELGEAVVAVRLRLQNPPREVTGWVECYAEADGWHRADSLQRQLETHVATMDEEASGETALALVRVEHEELLKVMASGFSAALQAAKWSVPQIMHQTAIYPEVVKTMGRKVAYVWVDAMRYEMGVELSRQLQGTRDLMVRPAVAALPSITPICMAALLPGASSSFSVVEQKGKVAANIDGTVMPGISQRLKHLKASVPDVEEMTLDQVLNRRKSDLCKRVEKATLIVVRSDEIDSAGENVGDLTARAAMERVIGNLARGIRRLAEAGVEAFVVTADHGHLFAIRKDDDMKTDGPGGETVGLHRRCWIGHGGTTPPGTVRVTGTELGYATDLDFIFPTGLGVFKAGGDLSFHHGGYSLQELVIPVLSFRMATANSSDHGEPVGVSFPSLPEAITNRMFSIQLDVTAGLFQTDMVDLRILLLANNEQVGRPRMVTEATLDSSSGLVTVKPNSKPLIGLGLTRDDCMSIRIVVQSPTTDAVLAQSPEIPVKLGM